MVKFAFYSRKQDFTPPSRPCVWIDEYGIYHLVSEIVEVDNERQALDYFKQYKSVWEDATYIGIVTRCIPLKSLDQAELHNILDKRYKEDSLLDDEYIVLKN